MAILKENSAFVFPLNLSPHVELSFMCSNTFYGEGSGAQHRVEAAGELLPGTWEVAHRPLCWELPPSPPVIHLSFAMMMHKLTTCKSHCWCWDKAASWEGSVVVLSVTSVWMGAACSLHKPFSSPCAIFSLSYFALNIIEGFLLLWVAPLWMESAVSLVYFGYNGCAPLYYCSPWLAYVLFLDSLRVSTRGGVEAKCDPQMSTAPPVALLCWWPMQPAEEGHLCHLGCHHPSPLATGWLHAIVCRSEMAVWRLVGGQHRAWLTNIWELLYVVYYNYRWASSAEFGLFGLLQSKLQGSVFRG